MPLMNPHCAAIGDWNVTTRSDAADTADDARPTNWPLLIPVLGQLWNEQDLLSSGELAKTIYRAGATPGNNDDTLAEVRATLERGLIACSSSQPCAANGKPLAKNGARAPGNLSPTHASAGLEVHRWSPTFWILLSATLIGVLGVVFWLLRKKWFGARETLLRAARSGLKRGEFYLEYQPIVNLRQGKCVGVEALLRWDNFEFGAVGPGHYMPYIEQSSLIGPITRFVLRQGGRGGRSTCNGRIAVYRR
jgi:hypothetical protein